MAKINIPLGLDGSLDKTDESMKLSELIYNPNRTDAGQGMYRSKTSNIEYNTDDYPDDPDIYNKGDIGLIRIFWKELGGPDGFILMAADINNINSQLIPATPTTQGFMSPEDKIKVDNIPPKVYTLVLPVANWVGYEEDKFRQQLTIPNLTENSKVDFDTDIETQELLNGVIIPLNIGGVLYATTLEPPDVDISVQATVTEVSVQSTTDEGGN